MNIYSTRFLARHHAGLMELANRGLDALGLLVSSFVIWFGTSAPLEPTHDWVLLVLLNTMFSFLLYEHAGLYRSWRGRPLSDQVSRFCLISLCCGALTFLVWHLLNLTSLIAPGLFASWLALNVFLIGGQRVALQLGVRYYRRRGLNAKKILIYGAGPLGRSIVAQTKQSPEAGYRVIAFLDDDSQLIHQILEGIPVVGNPDSLSVWLKETDVDEIWLALPLAAMQRVEQILEVANAHMICVRLYPDLNGLTLLNHSVSEMLGAPVIDLNVNRMQGGNWILKALEDKLLGLLFFFIALPMLGLIALAIRLTSAGPVIFRQRRHGWDGRPFTIYKFRTMVVHSEPNGRLTQAAKNDPRLTSFGCWLRRTSLDELPQLFNVLQGRMSLVGPRPHAIEHNDFYSRKINGYMRRHRVKPGITGWAQINDLRGEITELEGMSRRLKHDLFYIEHWSLWFDLRIIVSTILKLLFGLRGR